MVVLEVIKQTVIGNRKYSIMGAREPTHLHINQRKTEYEKSKSIIVPLSEVSRAMELLND